MAADAHKTKNFDKLHFLLLGAFAICLDAVSTHRKVLIKLSCNLNKSFGLFETHSPKPAISMLEFIAFGVTKSISRFKISELINYTAAFGAGYP